MWSIGVQAGRQILQFIALGKIRRQNEELVQIEDMGQCFFYIHKRKQNIRKDLNVNKVYARLLCPQLTLDKPFGIVRQNRVR
jgi:hypothetical protein